ncbi:MAG: hypothetical protein QXT45_04770 [Candidatus Bilamarchaeaceae archaeon]
MITLTMGTTEVSVDVQVVDDSGLPVTGLFAATFPNVYISRGVGPTTPLSLADLSSLDAPHSTGGVKERGGGFYRLDLPDTVTSQVRPCVTIWGEDAGLRLLCPRIQVINRSGTEYVVIPAALAQDADRPNHITILRGDTFALLFTEQSSLGDLSSAQEIWFTVKRRLVDLDDQAVIQITESQGLIRLNGVAYPNPLHGSLAIVNSLLGEVRVMLAPEVTSQLAATPSASDLLFADVQVKYETGTIRTPIHQWRVRVASDVTRAI